MFAVLIGLLIVYGLASMFLVHKEPQCPIEEPVTTFEHCNYIDHQ